MSRSNLRRCILVFAGAALGRAVSLFGQAEPPIPEALKAQALTVRISSIVANPGVGASAESETVKLALSGSPIAIKLVGNSLLILIQLTPYVGKDRSVLLVAQAVVVVLSGDKEVRRLTSLSTLSAAFSEEVYYYPVGVQPDGSSPIKLRIVIEEYVDPQAAGPQSLPVGQSSAPTPTVTPPASPPDPKKP